MRRVGVVGLGVALLLALAGCDGETACPPGQQVSCPCNPEGQGVQVCREDGSGFGACTGCTGGDSGAGGAGGAAPMACASPNDCPGDDAVCGWRTCDAGLCGRGVALAGWLAEEEPTLGDCAVHQCDGHGTAIGVVDKTDFADDGNQCTHDQCEKDGSTSHTPVAEGTPCAGGACNGVGVCAP